VSLALSEEERGRVVEAFSSLQGEGPHLGER
jgi:organic radical activating enzyme